MKNRLLSALILLLLFSTYNIQNTFSLSSKIKIQEVIVENNLILDEQMIKKKLSFLYRTNIFLLNTDKIASELKGIDFINSFEIKKLYPDKIKIKVFEKKPIAVIQNKQVKKYFTNSGEIINFIDLKEYNDLPIVFGDKENFLIFYQKLKQANFPINEVKKFYLFESKRWDLITNNDQVIKLPIKNYESSLNNFIGLKKKPNFQKFKTFDYRIKDQLILK
tara:strand:+ start:15713 stop:16372 length:660 start_codon:yes stop_codon:yes gene_type:complete